MTTPMRPLPGYVDRWTSRTRWLRWMDALLAWLGVWLTFIQSLQDLIRPDQH